jgi:hypothetical protein
MHSPLAGTTSHLILSCLPTGEQTRPLQHGSTSQSPRGTETQNGASVVTVVSVVVVVVVVVAEMVVMVVTVVTVVIVAVIVVVGGGGGGAITSPAHSYVATLHVNVQHCQNPVHGWPPAKHEPSGGSSTRHAGLSNGRFKLSSEWSGLAWRTLLKPKPAWCTALKRVYIKGKGQKRCLLYETQLNVGETPSLSKEKHLQATRYHETPGTGNVPDEQEKQEKHKEK